MMTKNELTKLLATTCPACGHDEITGDSVEIGQHLDEPEVASQDVWCDRCHASWTNYYRMTHQSPYYMPPDDEAEED